MSGTPMDVLVAGYQDIETARTDFDRLVGLVKVKMVKVEGVILVSHDADGDVTIADAGDHVGRKGLGWGAGVGDVQNIAPGMIPRIYGHSYAIEAQLAIPDGG